MKRIVLLILAILAYCGSASASSFSYVRSIVLNHAQVPNSDQANFPVYIKVAATELKTTANGGHVLNANGYDLVFFSDSALQSKLSYEVESYDGVNGVLSAWVAVPVLSHTNDTTIYLGYSNPYITSSLAASPWDATFLGVYHFGDGTTLSSADSTPNHKNGNPVTAAATAGVLGGAIALTTGGDNGSRFEPGVTNFDVAQVENSGPNAPLNTTKSYSVSFWMYYNGAKGYNASLWDQPYNPGYSAYFFYLDPNTSEIRMFDPYAVDGNVYPGTGYYVTNGWHHFAFTTGLANNQATIVYVDGRQVAAIPTKNLHNYSYHNGQSQPLYVGGMPPWWNPNYFLSSIQASFDELQFSNVVRSGDWIATSYNNQVNPGAFMTFSAETAAPGSRPPTVFKAQVLGSTPTQATIAYTAPDNNACSVAVSDNPTLDPISGKYVTVVRDVDPGLFAGADQDTRAGSLVMGATRTITVGQRTTGPGLDGRIYSRALQANTQHYFTISCANGTYQAQGTFTTANILLGNGAPDALIFNPNAFGNYGWPTIDFNDLSKTYIDPLTGAQIRRWTQPGDEGTGYTTLNFLVSEDLNKAWQNGAGLGSSSAPATAVYQGQGGPANSLFIWGALNYYRPSYNPVAFNVADDVQLHLSGHGDQANAADRIMTACLSADYGQSCLGSTIDLTLPQNQSADTYGPGAFPSKMFHGWGDARVQADMLSNNFVGAAQLSNGVITWIANSSFGNNIYFPVNVLKPGDKISLAGTDPYCPRNLCTIASVVNEKTLTIAQTVPQWSPALTKLSAAVAAGATSITVAAANGFNQDVYGGYHISIESDAVTCTTLSGNTLGNCSGINNAHAANTAVSSNSYFFPNFGFKVWKKTGVGAIYLDSARTVWTGSAQMFTGFQGAEPYCSPSIVYANYAADGVTPIAPLPGRLCTLLSDWGAGHLYFVAMTTGEARKLTNFAGLSVAEDGGDATKFYAYDQNSHNIQVCYYNVNDAVNGRFKAWNDNYDSNQINPAFTCGTVLTAGAGNDVVSQIKASFPQIDMNYFGMPSLASIYGNYFSFTMRARQNGMAWFCIVDLGQPLGKQAIKCRNTWDTYPLRWAGAHGDQIMNGPYLELVTMNSLSSQGTYSIERWDLHVNTIYNNGGSTALSSNFYDPQSCEQLGVSDPRWKAMGATGQNCIRMNVANEPLAQFPDGGDLGPAGSFPVGSKPMAWSHNAASCGGDGSTQNCYSYLQPMQEGDAVQDAAQDFGGEKFVIVKKTVLADGTFDLVLLRSANPSNCQASSTPSSHAANWTPMMWVPGVCGGATLWNGITDPASATYTDNPPQSGFDNGIFGGHSVLRVMGSSILQYTPYVWNLPGESGGYGSGYGVRQGPFPDIIGKGAQYGVNDLYPFAGSTNGLGLPFIQSHPGGNQYAAPASEQYWGLDGRPLGGAGGGSQLLWYHTFQQVAGNSSVYKISLPLDGPNGNVLSFSATSVNLDRKRRQTFGFAGEHLLQDISGPASAITDQTPWTYCIADFAGECVAGSHQGDQFVSVPRANTDGLCLIDYQLNTPCLATMGPEIAAYTQFGVDRPDPFGQRWRKLTYMLGGPARTSNYANIHSTAGGEWGVSAVSWADGLRGDVYGVKMLPWPNEDSTARTGFVSVPVTMGTQNGSSVRIRFGYDTKLFCSSRMEQCSTAVANGDPYAWVGEPQQWTPCSTGSSCKVVIPAVAGRTLYYIIDRKDASGVIQSGPVQMVPVN